ncbi:CPBP family intramembrane glutamic endopeptidase [Exiguobacterium sp. s155]|nr:CPBP family intramembrane glutamic endopeptidase [Exiguobacterium sp. s155]
MIVSAGIFTLAHLPTTNTLLVNFVSGLVFAWVYERTNSIYSSMLIHGTFNGLAVLLTALA